MNITLAKLSLACLLVVVGCFVTGAQTRGTSCDLTYEAILKQNKLDKIEWIQKWFKTYSKSPAPSWISMWRDDPIVTSVLIEHPNFHAAERTTLLLVRTKSQAFYWESVQSDYYSTEEIEKRTQRKEIEAKEYDTFFETVSPWKQAEVLKPSQPIDGSSPEFWGILTVFTNAPCRQILLGWDDFIGCPSQNCKPGPERMGRVMKALSPILL